MLERNVLLTRLIMGAACRWCRKMALGQHQSHSATTNCTRVKKAQAHPPAAGAQPLPLFEQHHAFFATDQPAIQLANPALQSYGSAMGDGAQPPPWVWQPLP